MKVYLMAAFAAATMMGAASAASIDEIEASYSPEAFADDDENWRRITANRIDECGRYGDNRNLRLNVLIDRYNAIGSALDSGDSESAMKAAKSLSRAINANGRFEKCWDTVARREGVSRDFRNMIKDM